MKKAVGLSFEPEWHIEIIRTPLPTDFCFLYCLIQTEEEKKLEKRGKPEKSPNGYFMGEG